MPNLIKAFLRWKEVILITASARLILIIITSITSSKTSNLLHPWVQWDGPHYLDLAKNWYQEAGQESLWIVFYPLYPILIRIFNFLINDFATASIVVSILFSFSASILLFELTLLDFSKRNAILAVWFLNIFPTAYFLQASYTESVFLTLTMLSIYLFRQNRYLGAGCAGALATMTRINGLTLLPLLFLEIKTVGKNIVTLLLIPVGFLIYLLINYLTFKDPLYFFQPLSLYWNKKFAWPWEGISSSFANLWYYQDELFYAYIFEFMAIAVIFLAIIFAFFKMRKSYAVYMLINLLLFTSTGFILSTPRYTLILFPIFMALGMIKDKRLITLLSLIFLSLLVYFTTLYTQGKWAF